MHSEAPAALDGEPNRTLAGDVASTSVLEPGSSASDGASEAGSPGVGSPRHKRSLHSCVTADAVRAHQELEAAAHRFVPLRMSELPPSAGVGLPLETLREVQDVLTSAPWLLALPELAPFRAFVLELAELTRGGGSDRMLRQASSRGKARPTTAQGAAAEG